MLGVGSSISSVVENKYNISLNGTSDYINIDNFTQHADLANGMAWSLAVWFKGNGSATSGAHTNILFSAHSSDTSNRLRIGVDADGTKGLYYADAQVGGRANIGEVDLDDGNWHLAVISRPSGLDQTLKVYIDGSSNETGVANTEVLWDNDLTFASIGQEYDPVKFASDFFGGEIAQLAFWKTDLDSNDVDAIYSAGRNADLNAPQGNYQDHGSIIGYWKMGDGLFDDKVNGAVHNQANPGFGSELVLNGDFEELSDEKINIAGGTPQNASNWANATLTTVDFTGTSGSGATYYDSINSGLTNGKTYKLTLTVSNFSGTSDFGFSGTGGVPTTARLGNNGSVTVYFVSNGANLRLFGRAGLNSGTMTVSVKQVDHNNRWSVGSKWSIANGAARLVSNDSNASGFIQSSVFTIGNTYNITFDATVVSGSAKLEKNGGAVLVRIDETKTYSHTFVADKEDMYFNRLSSVSDITIDNISAKKLNDGSGLATGATFVADN